MDATPSATTEQARTLEQRRATQEAQLKALWRMSPEERESAMWGSRLSLFQLLEWSRKRPHEVPKLGREFAWIVMTTPEWAEVEDVPSAQPSPEATDDGASHCTETGKAIRIARAGPAASSSWWPCAPSTRQPPRTSRPPGCPDQATDRSSPRRLRRRGQPVRF